MYCMIFEMGGLSSDFLSVILKEKERFGRWKVLTQFFSRCLTAGKEGFGAFVSSVFDFSDTLFTASTSISLSTSMSISSPENPKLNVDAMLQYSIAVVGMSNNHPIY